MIAGCSLCCDNRFSERFSMATCSLDCILAEGGEMRGRRCRSSINCCQPVLHTSISETERLNQMRRAYNSSKELPNAGAVFGIKGGLRQYESRSGEFDWTLQSWSLLYCMAQRRRSLIIAILCVMRGPTLMDQGLSFSFV